jgi:hypothetical protein
MSDKRICRTTYTLKNGMLLKALGRFIELMVVDGRSSTISQRALDSILERFDFDLRWPK